VVEAFRTDLAEGVAYGIEHKDETPMSAAIYGGVPGGPTPEAEEFVREIMISMLDDMQDIPDLPDDAENPRDVAAASAATLDS
jgi:sphinganine-1-phosphate aldolase